MSGTTAVGANQIANPGVANRPAFKRKVKWIRPDLQMKVVLRTLFVALLTLLVNFQLNLIGYWLFLNGGAENSEEVLTYVPTLLMRYFLFSLAIAVPLSIAVGILYSFKFCGPIYRFKRFFEDLRDGRWDRSCVLRQGDDLHDVKDVINGAMDVLNAQIREQRQLLLRARRLLEAPDANISEKARLANLLDRVQKAEAEYARRFGGADAAESGETEADAERSVAVAANA